MESHLKFLFQFRGTKHSYNSIYFFFSSLFPLLIWPDCICIICRWKEKKGSISMCYYCYCTFAWNHPIPKADVNGHILEPILLAMFVKQIERREDRKKIPFYLYIHIQIVIVGLGQNLCVRPHPNANL